MPEAYRQASAIAFVAKDNPPFLIVHGGADTTVPFSQAETFYNALKAAGVDAKLVKIEGGEHNSVLNPNLQPAIQEFLDQHLRKR